MSARLAHEGYDTSRMYEWPWIEREKDHRAVDIRVIGLLPITPFSTLVMWPLTGLAPLTAKHIWILLNLVFLIPIGWMLRSMTGLSYQRVALALALCFPLHRNLSYGQFYVFLLSADRCGVLGLSARVSRVGRRAGSGCCGLQDLPGTVYRLLHSTQGLAGAELECRRRAGCSCVYLSRSLAGTCIAPICTRFCPGLCTAKVCRRM